MILASAAFANAGCAPQQIEQLGHAHTETFGDPVPASVRLHPLAGKAILISGHDLHYLYQLLVQTEGLGINIYTHGEMLPAHGYPKLKAFKHLAGNYGGAWIDQADDFDAFPGALLMTSNCIQKPKTSTDLKLPGAWRVWAANPPQRGQLGDEQYKAVFVAAE